MQKTNPLDTHRVVFFACINFRNVLTFNSRCLCISVFASIIIRIIGIDIMKAVILTYAPLKSDDEELLKNTKLFKLALNHHSAELCPNARIITDYVLDSVLKNTSEKIVTVRDRRTLNPERTEYFDGEFKGATILSAIEYLISKGFDEILIAGNNKVNNKKFRELVYEEINNTKYKAKIYQYSDGYFNLPTMSVREFCEI